jgi:inner membrane protein
VRLDAKPNLGNLLVWRTLYEWNGRYYVDAVRLGTFADNKLFEGRSVEKLDTATAFPELGRDSVQYTDLRRFSWFADDWLAADADLVGDLRYGRLPNSTEPLWGIRVDPKIPNVHVKYESFSALRGVDMMRSVTFGLE